MPVGSIYRPPRECAPTPHDRKQAGVAQGGAGGGGQQSRHRTRSERALGVKVSREHTQIPSWDIWVAQAFLRVRLSISARVSISGSWVRAPRWALRWAWSLLQTSKHTPLTLCVPYHARCVCQPQLRDSQKEPQWKLENDCKQSQKAPQPLSDKGANPNTSEEGNSQEMVLEGNRERLLGHGRLPGAPASALPGSGGGGAGVGPGGPALQPLHQPPPSRGHLSSIDSSRLEGSSTGRAAGRPLRNAVAARVLPAGCGAVPAPRDGEHPGWPLWKVRGPCPLQRAITLCHTRPC